MNIKESLLALFLALFPGAAAQMPAPAPLYDVSGNYVLSMEYQGNDYLHDLSITQDADGDLSGTGGSPAGAHVYTWTIVDGKVVGNDIDFTAAYTATADAVTPLTTLIVDGKIASDGTLSGTWSDNYQGGSRSGNFESVSGTAGTETPENVTLSAEDFGVVNYDTGVGMLKGYSAGFGLSGETFNDVESVVVKLYAGSKLLQTNTATNKLMTDITGSQVSSPFDVSGNFNYSTDGFWNNVREREYGQTKAATRVVATVTLEDGTVLTAVNTTLSGNASTIMPNIGSDDGDGDNDGDHDDGDDDGDKPDKDKNKDKDECKKGGWKTFTNSIFKNQGQCVSKAARN